MAGGGSAWSDSTPLLDSSPHRDRFSVEMATAVPLEVPRRSVFLGVDVGTGSARAGLFDEDGKLLGSASSPIQIWKEGDCVEQSSTDIWHSICAAVKSACSLASVAGEEVTGLGFAATCSLGNGKDSTHGTTTESQYQVWIVQHLLVKEDDLKLLVELMKRISRVDGTCEWTNGNTRMPATYVAWTLCPSLHTCARMHPITVTLWDQFSEIEAAAMANLPGTFPVAIGMRLKMSNYHGIGLATRNSSICGDHLHDLIESYGLEENVHHREQNMAHPD